MQLSARRGALDRHAYMSHGPRGTLYARADVRRRVGPQGVRTGGSNACGILFTQNQLRWLCGSVSVGVFTLFVSVCGPKKPRQRRGVSTHGEHSQSGSTGQLWQDRSVQLVACSWSLSATLSCRLRRRTTSNQGQRVVPRPSRERRRACRRGSG